MAFQDIFTRNYWFPTVSESGTKKSDTAKGMNRYITPVRFERLKVDIASWRDAIREAEQSYYPHRVKMQRIYQDTILNGQVDAAMSQRKNLTLLKDFALFDGKNENVKATELLKREWFYSLMNYALDAKAYGYSLINLGDMVDNEFPNLNVVRRQNVNPGWYTREGVRPPYLNSMVYQLSGVNFTDPNIRDEAGNSYYDWSIWIDTPSEAGQLPCGFGYLYKVAYYEILIRNNMGFNATALELFGQPLRVGKTVKQDDYERSTFEEALAKVGSSGYMLMDPTDEVEFIEAKTGTGKNQGFDNFDQRCNKMISKIIFGHSDAMDSVQGKLGGEHMALEVVERLEKVDNQWMEFVINTKVIPKLQNIGLDIPVGCLFRFKNDKETEEGRKKEDENNVLTAQIAQTMKNAGLQMDAEYFTQRTGIPVKKIETPPVNEPQLSESFKDKLKNLYKWTS